MKRIFKIAAALLALASQLSAMAADVPVKLFKNPNCYCCDLYARHLEQHGFKVELVNSTDMTGIKQKYGIPEKLEGCHTAVIEGYVVEGLVPAQFVQQLLRSRPKVRGIALPGMPTGAPGMDGPRSKPLVVYTLQNGKTGTGSASPVFGTF